MQLQLIHETITDAISEVVSSAGGIKTVAMLMYPAAATPEIAAGKLRDRINNGRREVFNQDQVMFFVRLGRQHGCHALINFMSREAGYADPTPIEPEDEIARLQREFIAASKSMNTMASRIEALTASAVRRVA